MEAKVRSGDKVSRAGARAGIRGPLTLARKDARVLSFMESALQTETQAQKSFDVLASVRMLRYDLAAFDRVLPETLQRVYDEELTYIAEGINRPLHTEFTLQSREGELVYFDKGAWVPYTGMLIRGLEIAEAEAAVDPRKDLQVRRAQQDLVVGYQLRKLHAGQRMQWYSTHPEEEAERYGEEFIASLGYQPKRQMGFLYQAFGNEDGSVTMHSQSVDNSDERAFQAAMQAGEQDGDIDAMRQSYDQVLATRHKTRVYAGQFTQSFESTQNAWELIRRHDDLIGHYLTSLEALASDDLSETELSTAKKRLTYGVWAALKERLDHSATRLEQVDTSLQGEIDWAYRQLAARGEMLFGCGGAISAEGALLAAESGDVFDAVFGEKAGNETLVWKDGYCRVDNCPSKPGKTKVAQCSVCRGCQTWFDRGRDPSKIYRGLRRFSETSRTQVVGGKKRTTIAMVA